ncbi:MAG: polysaccharide deacetylase family protein [Hyphomicrobiaceae bacterium]
MARIRDEGHEILHHGLAHENPADFDEAGERDILRRGIEAIERSAGVRPLGYRSPAWELSPATLSLLREEGFLYESSCMGRLLLPAGSATALPRKAGPPVRADLRSRRAAGLLGPR